MSFKFRLQLRNLQNICNPEACQYVNLDICKMQTPEFVKVTGLTSCSAS